MNKERILELADVIEGKTHHRRGELSLLQRLGGRERFFNMDTYNFECGAPACLAGWAIHLFDDSDDRHLWPPRRLVETAGRLLGLTHEQASKLFLPDPLVRGGISPERAAKTLRHLAKTGKVIYWYDE